MTILLEPHPFAEVFPTLDGEAFNALVQDIEARDQQEPIVVYEGKILDGRNRYRACQILGREPEVREFTGDDAMGFVLSANLHRRHLNEGQRAMVGASLNSLVVGANQHSTRQLVGLSAKAAADLLNVSTASIERAKAILRSGDTDLINAVTAGKTSVAAGAEAAKKGKGKSKTQSSDTKPETKEDKKPETEEEKLAKKKLKLSDTNDELVEKLMDNLIEWKKVDAVNAITATSNLLSQLKAAELIEERKGRKAA